MSASEGEFVRIVRENHASLRYFIRGLGVNPAWVDDVAQDAFLVAYRKWQAGGEIQNPGAWLRTIARNLVLNELSKAQRRQRLLDGNLTGMLLQAGEGGTDTVESECERKERHAALEACMQNLTDRARSVLESRYVKELNSGQIGEAMAMKPAAVRKLLFHARQTLAACLKQTLAGNP